MRDTHLAINRRPYDKALPKLAQSEFVEGIKLPSHKRVVVRVEGGGEERSNGEGDQLLIGHIIDIASNNGEREYVNTRTHAHPNTPKHTQSKTWISSNLR